MRFDSDYMEGCHPAILERMAAMNLEKTTGYGQDEICGSAAGRIRSAMELPDAEIFFLTGGTQANAAVIAAMLRNYEGVIAAESGHIAVHEAGAVEAAGHKVLTLPQHDGKLCAEALERYLKSFFADETCGHMVQPGMVYLSHPTETGTLYSLEELKAIRSVCDAYGLILYVDGARLGYGLAAEGTDVTLPFLAGLCDAFYIGGTKVGALFGEAVVFTGRRPVPHFFTTVKQRGALLAKGWLLGLQFDTLFTDNLYLKIAGNAIRQAMRLKRGLLELGFSLYADSPTNQQFVILENRLVSRLAEQVSFNVWEKTDERHTAIRLVTSWATTAEQVDSLLLLLSELKGL